MEILRGLSQLHCPTDLFGQYCRLEQVQLLVEAMGSQVKAGTFLCQLRRSLSADGQYTWRHASLRVQQLQNKLEAADLLMVVHTLGAGQGYVLALDAPQLRQLQLVHYARHGPTDQLQMVLYLFSARPGEQSRVSIGNHAAAASPGPGLALQDPDQVLSLRRPTRQHLVNNSAYHAFPLLFQPLLGCHVGWLDRLEILLHAGADAATVYEPWRCSALHMLFYRKESSGTSDSDRVPEAAQVQAIQLLLQHGAKGVLNLTDACAAAADGRTSSTPTQRTALLQAASAGRFQACRALLAAGADATAVDSCNQSMLDYLFYLKHSNVGAHRRATAGYTCMQLYGLVNEFHLHALVTDELEQDCRSCGRCRFLLASCAIIASSEESEQSDTTESESDEEAVLSSDEQSNEMIVID